ncbi:RNA polymerase sigma factor [Streptococcus oricebi]|uniref:RNA polymerase subunit sigma-70 n=1 Tax=Streptococcus oricebi TaxID=1547447 RepID=A0ABS5B3K9_9STRE|nr:RNA polymerase sigma factor [Streptococcus oricebi]MBP2622549.1 RNA polymerase subunit sigma-70 [Streptococcus oricebi]
MLGFAREIVSYLQRSGASKAEAEDVVQDVFVKMLEADLIIPAQKMRAWMYRVSIRRYIDCYRRQKRYMEILQKEFFINNQVNPFENEDYDFLAEEVAKLPEAEAALIDLYYFQNFTIKEIAQIMSYSVSKVKIQLMRSRKKLRRNLEEKGYHNGNI